eukprot:606709-Prorocentrum_minimum.AAC.1
MHPDKGGSAEAFQALAEAHAALTDSAKRRSYDEGDDLPRDVSPGRCDISPGRCDVSSGRCDVSS